VLAERAHPATGDPARNPEGSAPGGRPARRRAARSRWAPYLLIAPSLIAIGVLFAYPVFLVLRISFQRLGLGELVRRVTTYVGLDNYRDILADPEFGAVVLRTVLFTAVCVTVTMVLGTAIGLLLVRLSRPVRLAAQASLVLAWAVPIITATVLWQWLFDQTYGVLNWLLSAVGLDFEGHDWFTSGLSTFGVIATIIVWQAVPFVALTVQAGLLAIPADYHEAARIDGAGPVRVFTGITAPLLRPILVVLTFLSTIWDFKVFTQVFAVRQGGPNGATITLPLYLYNTGIASSRFGLAAAGAVIMVAILAVAMVAYLRRMVRTEVTG
jgi:N,N'-diacetylchitobiose transport system permease protein